MALVFGLQGVALATTDCTKAENYPTVTKAELQDIVKNKSAFIVDVNSADSFKKTHVPGAVHFFAIEKTYAQALPADKSAPIVAYCGGEMCTAWKDAAEKACALGYANIKHYKGGIKGWNDKKI